MDEGTFISTLITASLSLIIVQKHLHRYKWKSMKIYGWVIDISLMYPKNQTYQEMFKKCFSCAGKYKEMIIKAMLLLCLFAHPSCDKQSKKTLSGWIPILLGLKPF